MQSNSSARAGCFARVFFLALSLGVAVPLHGAQADGFTPRPTAPRIAPLAPDERNEVQKAWLAKRADVNLYKTYIRHPDLVRAIEPFGNFTFNGSSLPARDREMTILRMGWLCQAEYEWAQHSRIAKASAGLTDADVRRIAEGPDAAGWSDFERALLRMVDELRYDGTVSDATWQTLRAKYSDPQIIDAIATAAQYQYVSMLLNSLGIQLDPGLPDRLPRDLKLPALAERPTTPRPAKPRMTALAEAEMTPQQRELVKPQTLHGVEPNFYARLLASHPKLYGPYMVFDNYVQREVLLPPKTRELLILRTAWNTRDAYGWAHHVEAAKAVGFTDADVARVAAGPSVSGWNEDQTALLRAADELHREAFISNATWKTLSSYYDSKQLLDIIAVVGNYAIDSLVANSLGIQVEPGFPAMPID